MSLDVMEEAGRHLSPPLLRLMTPLLMTVQSNVEIPCVPPGKKKVAKVMLDRASSHEALAFWKVGRVRVWTVLHRPSSPQPHQHPGSAVQEGLDLRWEPESLFTGLLPAT